MRELVNSMTRFSAAMTLFGIQQLENALGAATDSATYIARFRESLDSVTDAITSQLSAASKPTLASVSNLGTDLVDRTFDTLTAPAFDPRQIIETASTVMRRTAYSLSASAAAGAGAAGSRPNEPQRADDALTSR